MREQIDELSREQRELIRQQGSLPGGLAEGDGSSMTTVVVVGVRWNAMFVVSERTLREKIDLGL